MVEMASARRARITNARSGQLGIDLGPLLTRMHADRLGLKTAKRSSLTFNV